MQKILWSQKLDGNSVAVLPTGAGKSLIIAELAKRLDQDVLILQPGREILTQNYDKLCNYVDTSEIGIYSASMNTKEIKKYTLATIGSIYKKPEYFSHFKTVLLDECHLLDPKNLDGMLTSFLTQIGAPRVVGFSATPWRMSLMYRHDDELGLQAITTTKLITRMKGRFWHRIIYKIDIAELIKDGYLVPLRYIDKSVVRHADIPLNVSHSEFDLDRFERRIVDKREEIIDALEFAKALCKSVLVFCVSVAQAEDLSRELGGEVVSAKTPKKTRLRVVQGFKDGGIQMVFNVGVLTTGFDHPGLDCIVMLRPSRSLALIVQQIGRGVRAAPGKKFCRVIDLVGNVSGMGRLETIRVVKREKWEIESETNPNWHNYPLDSFQIRPPENPLTIPDMV